MVKLNSAIKLKNLCSSIAKFCNLPKCTKFEFASHHKINRVLVFQLSFRHISTDLVNKWIGTRFWSENSLSGNISTDLVLSRNGCVEQSRSIWCIQNELFLCTDSSLTAVGWSRNLRFCTKDCLVTTDYNYYILNIIQVILDSQRLNIYAFPIPWSENHVEFSIFENCQQRRQTDSRENQHNKLYFC